LNAASLRRVSGALAEHDPSTRPDPAPMSDLAQGFAVENDVSLQTGRAEELSELPADVERWRWIVLGLGWGW
jgi:hypothetical protein